MTKPLPLLATLILFTFSATRAQPAPDDPIAKHFFPPDFVLQYQQALALTAKQRELIQSATQKSQAQVQETEKRVRNRTPEADSANRQRSR